MTSKQIQPVAFPAGCNMTMVGLEIPDGLPYNQWEGIGELLEQARRRKELELQAILWAIGDWLAYGETRYGEKYAQAVVEFGRAEQTLMNLAWVAGKIAPERRRLGLSHAHHAAIAALSPEDGDALLDVAEMEGGTSTHLRRLAQNRRIRAQGKDPTVERAKNALRSAVAALSELPRPQRVPMIIDLLVKPLASVAASEREQFLSAMVSGCCEVE